MDIKEEFTTETMTSSISTITAVLLNWKRPENIVKTIKSIRDQSLPVKICLWNNNPDDKTKYDADFQIDAPNNFKCYPRWMMASLVGSDYIFTLDDDLILGDNNIIEDVLNFYRSINSNGGIPIIGYTGVILNEGIEYWGSEHINCPVEHDIKVDIVKGRFMFMDRKILNNVNMENDETCEDIKISSYSEFKIIPGLLKNRLINLDEGGVGLFGSAEHSEKRTKATKKYFQSQISLRSIMTIQGSDKGGCGRFSCHNYTNFYELLFSKIRNRDLNIFELGLGTNNTDVLSNMGPSGRPGASLRGWKEYFANSVVYGADIDERVLFSEDRIKTYHCDQTSPEVILEMWNNVDLKDVEFDLIIDDGLHEYDANITFFENSLHKLKLNGYFIIEDIKINFLPKMKEYVSMAGNKYPDFEFSLVELYLQNNQQDNNLLIVRRVKKHVP